MNMGLFLRYVSPAMLGMVGLSCYILVDTLFVSLALGAPGLAALNLSISVFSVICGVGQMAGVGGGTDFSLRRGEGKDADASFYSALCFGCGISVLFVLCGLLFSRQLSLLLGADETTLLLTQTYVRVTLLFSPCHILNAILQAFVRNDGAPRLSMISMLVSSASNIVLDYLFMFPLGMGMFGAVLATGIAACLSILVLFAHFMRKSCTLRLRICRISLHETLCLLSYGLSAFIGEMASAVSLLTFNLILMRLGGYIAVAAYGIIANAALVATSVLTGVGQGTQPLASHAYGAQDDALLADLRRHMLMTVSLLGVLLFACAYLFAGPIASVFNHENNAQLHAIAVSGLGMYFSGYLFAGVNIACAAFLSATAYPGRALVISLLRSCALLVPAALAMSRLFGISGVWLSFAATEAVVCLLSLPSIRRALPGNYAR